MLSLVYLFAGSMVALLSFYLCLRVVTRLNNLLEGLSSLLESDLPRGVPPQGSPSQTVSVRRSKSKSRVAKKAVKKHVALGDKADGGVLDYLSKGFLYNEIPRSVFAAKRLSDFSDSFNPGLSVKLTGKRAYRRAKPRFEQIPENLCL